MPVPHLVKTDAYAKVQGRPPSDEEFIQFKRYSLMVARRNSAVVYTSNIEKHGKEHTLQLAMLNYSRHYNNYICGELNRVSDMLSQKGYSPGKLLTKVKDLHKETVSSYDELHDLNLWNSPDQVYASKRIRTGPHWQLDDEVETSFGKLASLTTLTEEICKVRNRNGRLWMSSVLAGLGFINLLQLIPIGQMYVVAAPKIWIPVITAGILITTAITLFMNRDE